jgi:Zn-dependent M16 (insulinase) family peptidase
MDLRYEGFAPLREEAVPEIDSLVRVLRHKKTGAELLHVLNSDENKVFGITFRTPPPDSTGVAHILEHSVLCGSRRYPVKEPFVELLKGSLQTFLNAFTYPDKTCYPVASQNLQDLKNLMDVYLDAVFHPRLTPEIFKQEGWHIEAESVEGPMGIKGVVYNEMKGAYSSPEGLLAEYSLRSLFPDTAYGLDSGGDPRHIPDLTYEDFISFHRHYYHPSNARIFLYGDGRDQALIDIIEVYLADFEPLEVDSSIGLQRPFEGPIRLTRHYLGGRDGGRSAMVTVNWALPDTLEAERNFSLRILEHCLLGMPGSPLRKALIDSGLGEDIAGEGLGTEIRQPYFSTGLKGVEADRDQAVEELILSTLHRLGKEGPDQGIIEAAFNTLEFKLRENNTGSLPRGLVLMLRALTTWLYGHDPLALIAFERPLSAVKAAYDKNTAVFQELIMADLVENKHRSTLVLLPDPGLLEKEEAREKSVIERLLKEKSREDVTALVRETKALRQMQETPDPPEALAAIPCLGLSDLDRKNRPLPIREEGWAGARVFLHELGTNGIAYVNLGLDLRGVPWGLLPYVPLFGRALLEMGTRRRDYVDLSRLIASRTGGIWPQVLTSPVRGRIDATAWLFMRGKAVASRMKDLFDIFREILTEVKLDQRERFRQMVLEERARQENRLVPSGHRMVALRIKSHFSENFLIDEHISGISYLFFLRDLARRVDEEWGGVLSDLVTLRDIIVSRATVIADLTLEGADIRAAEPLVRELIGAFPEGQRRSETRPGPRYPKNEGLTIPAQVNYVGKGCSAYSAGYRFHGSSLVVMRYLRTAWLWNQVRVKGGAYGAFCALDRLSGTITFTSYRDPNLSKTLDAFDRSAGFLRNCAVERQEITKAVIGAIGDMDAPMLPDAKGFTALARHLRGDTEEIRQRIREEVLGTEAAHFRDFAEVLDALARDGIVKVLGAQETIQAFKAESGAGLATLQVL